MSGQTGVSVSTFSEWLERQARYKRQDVLTARIAGILSDHGINPFREGEGFALVGLVTGMVKPAEQQYRRIHFLPSVAASLRGEIANALDLYLSGIGGHGRYAVMTSGPRCEVWEVRGRVVWLNRTISKWHHEICGPLGIDVLFRAIELPWEQGKGFHVHANVIYHPTRYIPEPKWKRFKKQTAAFFGTHWDDNGRLRDVREAVKYVMKGDDLEALADHDARQVAELYRQLKGLHLVQGLGGFRIARKDRKERRAKVVSIQEFSGRKLVEVDIPRRRPRDDSDDRSGGGLPRSNQVFCFGLPKAAFSNVKEPVALVSNLDLDSFWRDPDVMERARRGLSDWTRRGNFPPDRWFPGRRPFKVHTYTSIVRSGAGCGRVIAGQTAPGNPHAPRSPP